MILTMYLCGLFSLLFSILSFIPEAGIAFAAFPLSIAMTAFVSLALFRFAKGPSEKRLNVARKALEYLPFVLFAAFILRRAGEADGFFLLDLFTVLAWLGILISSNVLMHFLSDKRIYLRYPEMQTAAKRKKPIALQGLEWIDALIQAACLVLLVHLFFFQLYAIPSESMVPEFMIKDRVVVVKTPSGPKFPLSSVGFPRMRSYERGDIVVFNNPHYNDTKAARVRSFVSQLIYMITFTAVNINTDEFGELKADPLVKRITGESGEKLMLVDGKLYSRRRGDPDWKQVTEDASWATWNLASLPRSELALVKSVLLSNEQFAILESVESSRANVDLLSATVEARGLVSRFNELKTLPDTLRDAPDFYPRTKRDIYTMFQNVDEITRFLLTTNGGEAWFDRFMTSWIGTREDENLYESRGRNMNVLLKLAFGHLVVRNAELFASGATASTVTSDPLRNQLLMEAETYRSYMSFHDQRNMGEFPEGEDEYIPENNYFMMGDNRFNSLDMRHSYVFTLQPVDPGDALSFVYRSNLNPQYVSADRILGTALFRFWPLSRIGVPQ